MRTVQLSVFTAVMALLAASSCKNKKPDLPEPALPEATQTGQNSAGARVDGKTWRAQSDAVAGSGTSAFYSRVGGQRELTISLNRYTDEGSPFAQTHIRLSVPYITGPGTVLFNQYADPFTPPGNPAYAEFMAAANQRYITGPDATGILVITRLDTVARIVSGTFEFKGRLKNTTSEVNVMDGRFDIKLNP